MCDLDALQNYIQDKLGWPVWTHELPSKEVLEEIREKSKDDFISICLSNGNDLISRSALLKEIGDPDDGMVLPAKHGIIDLVKRAPAM